MHTLTHFRLCPFSRSIRLALAELGIEVAAKEERPWEWRAAFLALNPAGDLPVLEIERGPVLAGAYVICEYLAEETRRHPGEGRALQLLPAAREDRAEARRIIDWFHRKLDREVTRELLIEKVYARLTPGGERAPDADILRAVRVNLRNHLGYLGYLAEQRRWLAGDEMSFADLAAAAHLSVIDYLGEVPWDEFHGARVWYARIKSRPAFRTLLADRLAGMPPPLHYTDLDF
ncbi:MAG: glutathione S-transferase family protein [Pseudomonadota bacterium]